MGMTNTSMKKFLLLLVSILLAVAHAQAQDNLKAIRSKVTEVIGGKEYYIHTVKKGQTLYMISKAYGADINEVIRENPEVKEGIKADQKIRIPMNKPEEPPKKAAKSTPAEPKEIQPVPPPEEEPPCNSINPQKQIYNVALMLPLSLEDVEHMAVENLTSTEEGSYKPLHYIEFYEGFRMAMDSLEKSGVSVKVYVYDVGKDTVQTRRLLRNPEMKNMNLIIGAVFQKNFQIIADFAQKNGIYIVNPLSERDQIVKGHSKVIKVIPSKDSQYRQLAEILARDYSGGKILIVRNSQYKDKDAAEKLKTACVDAKLKPQVTEGYGAAIGQFSKEKENVVIVFSENKVYALQLLTKFNELRNDYRLTVVGLPKWDRIDGLEEDYLVNLKVHCMATEFTDYQDNSVVRFVAQFSEKYKTDPSRLAFEGYDCGFYFVSALQKYGKNFGRCLPEFRIKSLQTDFEFRQSGNNNGLENQHWEIFQYDNYRLRRVTGR